MKFPLVVMQWVISKKKI